MGTQSKPRVSALLINTNNEANQESYFQIPSRLCAWRPRPCRPCIMLLCRPLSTSKSSKSGLFRPTCVQCPPLDAHPAISPPRLPGKWKCHLHMSYIFDGLVEPSPLAYNRASQRKPLDSSSPILHQHPIWLNGSQNKTPPEFPPPRLQEPIVSISWWLPLPQ